MRYSKLNETLRLLAAVVDAVMAMRLQHKTTGRIIKFTNRVPISRWPSDHSSIRISSAKEEKIAHGEKIAPNKSKSRSISICSITHQFISFAIVLPSARTNDVNVNHFSRVCSQLGRKIFQFLNIRPGRTQTVLDELPFSHSTTTTTVNRCCSLSVGSFSIIFKLNGG